MQGSFIDIHDKLIDNLKKDLYYSDINELIKEYETITFNDTTFDEELIDVDLFSESNIKNKMVFFDVDKYLEKIFKSYKFNIDRAKCQFDMDFPRSRLFFNKVKYIKKNSILNIFNKFSKYKTIICNHELSLTQILITLCTQASFAFSFILMSELYNDNEKQIFVTSNDIKYNILNQKKLLEIRLDATYNIKKTTEDKNLSKIKITTDIQIILKENCDFDICKLGIVIWDIIPKNLISNNY